MSKKQEAVGGLQEASEKQVRIRDKIPRKTRLKLKLKNTVTARQQEGVLDG